MAVKMSGAEFKRYNWDTNAWPDGWWYEDAEITVNGQLDDDVAVNQVADSDVIVIRGGVVFQGDYLGKTVSMESHFKKWRKAQVTEFLVIEVEKSKSAIVIEAIVAAGVKVVR